MSTGTPVPEAPDSQPRPERPLVVDLDGTLLRVDLLHECANYLLTRSLWRLFSLVAWLAGGRAYLKARLAQVMSPGGIAVLPYNEPLLGWLRQQRAQGRVLVLATASHRLLAERIAHHAGVFEEVIATDDKTNMKGNTKRAALVSRFGEGGFDYVGNERADLPVWRSAARAYVVASTGSALVREVGLLGKLAGTFEAGSASRLSALGRCLRLHQWVKNLLVFVPLIAAHQYGTLTSVVESLLAFVAFGLAASSVYVLNDLADISEDRRHERKRRRPFASGELSALAGWLIWPILLAAAFALAAIALPWAFSGALAAYIVLTVAYSLRLKQSAMVDVLTLASLYTMRIVAGAAAISVRVSFWLLAFAIFLFFSLACIKRYSELRVALRAGGEERIPGRGYYPSDLDIMAMLGVAAGYIAVLVLALYIQDSHAADLYSRPEILWLVCPLLLYWVSRTWLFTHRGWMNEDPVVFALKDRISWYVGVLCVLAFVLARESA